jgi:hypothetical protein
MLFSNVCSVFVNKGLFATEGTFSNLPGPPSISEIRMSLRDTDAAENRLTDEIEFDAAEIVQAVLRPLRFWHEIPPPLPCMLTSVTFPFTEIWLRGIQAHLFEVAANHYRRNELPYEITGGAVRDKSKDVQYERVADKLMKDFRDLARSKKIEINSNLFVGDISSPYSYLFY